MSDDIKRYLVCLGRPGWPEQVWERVKTLPGEWECWGSARDWGVPFVDTGTSRFSHAFFLNYSHPVGEPYLSEWECVNFHCAPLPYGQGGGPIENLIRRDHTETVITAHRMTDELDAGPIYGMAGAWSTIQAYRELGVIPHDWPPQDRFLETGVISLKGDKERDILPRFVNPVLALITWIVEQEPEPIDQHGEPVTFRRLPADEYAAFWRKRA